MLNALKTRKDSVKIYKTYRKDKSRLLSFGSQRLIETVSVLGYHWVSESELRGGSSGPFWVSASSKTISSRGPVCDNPLPVACSEPTRFSCEGPLATLHCLLLAHKPHSVEVKDRFAALYWHTACQKDWRRPHTYQDTTTQSLHSSNEKTTHRFIHSKCNQNILLQPHELLMHSNRIDRFVDLPSLSRLPDLKIQITW